MTWASTGTTASSFPSSSMAAAWPTAWTTREVCLERCRRLIAAVADILQHAHPAGFIHRDIKPANILLDATASLIWPILGSPLPADDAQRIKTPHCRDIGLHVARSNSAAAHSTPAPTSMAWASSFTSCSLASVRLWLPTPVSLDGTSYRARLSFPRILRAPHRTETHLPQSLGERTAGSIFECR